MAGNKLGAIKRQATLAGLSLEDYEQRCAEGQKYCYKCTTWRSANEAFCKDTSRYDGRCAVCNPCRNVKVRVDTKGRISPFKGRTHSAEAKAAMSEKRKGKRYRAGIPCTPEQRAHISRRTRECAPRAEAHYNWRGGIAGEHARIRRSAEYADWRTAVFKRDSFACRSCGDARGGNLEAHHIQPFSTFPDLRLVLSNGITLCEPCHIEHHRRTGDPE